MDKIKGNLGFGFMRLPTVGEEVDIPATCALVDAFLDRGFNYFDTARGYHEGRSEGAIRDCLTSRHPRDSYVLTDKLTDDYFKSEEDIRPLFDDQLKTCGVEYFDFYLMHSQTAERYEFFKSCKAYETAFRLKEEGKIRHVGISFHDRSHVLDRILTDYPQIEVVQLQFNYLDYEDPAVESRKCYEVCRKHGKPVLVMEPVKGGNLAKLPPEAKAVLDQLEGGSPASYAIRFAAGFEGIRVVLSGMTTLEQVEDNTSFMSPFRPLDDRETAAIDRVREIFKGKGLIPCTACRYCIQGCPSSIVIPDLFAVMNSKHLYDDWNPGFYYNTITKDGGRASACVKCGRCETICPQHLPIRQLLDQVAQTFEGEEG